PTGRESPGDVQPAREVHDRSAWRMGRQGGDGAADLELLRLGVCSLARLLADSVRSVPAGPFLRRARARASDLSDPPYIASTRRRPDLVLELLRPPGRYQRLAHDTYP